MGRVRVFFSESSAGCPTDCAQEQFLNRPLQISEGGSSSKEANQLSKSRKSLFFPSPALSATPSVTASLGTESDFNNSGNGNSSNEVQRLSAKQRNSRRAKKQISSSLTPPPNARRKNREQCRRSRKAISTTTNSPVQDSSVCQSVAGPGSNSKGKDLCWSQPKFKCSPNPESVPMPDFVLAGSCEAPTWSSRTPSACQLQGVMQLLVCSSVRSPITSTAIVGTCRV